MTTSAEVYVPLSAPPLTPRPYGLFTVAPPANGDRVGFGAAVMPSIGCLAADSWRDACLSGEAAADKTPTRWPCDATFADAFTVYVLSSRSSIDDELADATASGALAAAEERAVESHLWDQMTAGAINGGTHSNLAVVLATVEGNLAANYNGRGVIHMSPYSATILASFLDPRDNRQYTKACGTPVVVGAGYGDPDTPTVEVIGTGGLIVRRDDLVEHTAWDRAINDISTLAERNYLTAWDCFAVRASVQEG